MSMLLQRQFQPEMLVEYIIQNSEVITVGDFVFAKTNGFALRQTPGTAILGVVVDIIDVSGNSVFGSIAALGSATITAGTGPGVGGIVTVASTNQTVDMIKVRVNISKFAIYSATVTGTMNTTFASNTQGGWVNTSGTTGTAVDETTHVRTISTARHLKAWGVDPNNTARMLVSIRDSEIFTDGSAGYNVS